MEGSAPEVARLFRGLDTALETSLEPLRSVSGPLGILFSGGVDSALLAWELRARPRVILWTLGAEGSPDREAAEPAARKLGLPWNEIPIDPNVVATAERKFGAELKGSSPPIRSVLISLALAVDRAESPRLVCGQGADELFLGYAHFRGLDAKEASRRMEADLRQLRESDWPRTREIARRAGKELIAPYLGDEFEAAARQVPIELRLPGSAPKRFFREWAVHRGLPEELATRAKKAIQFGSGVDRIIRRERKESH
jgi:asparagine synthase (glutamine-hydrolysing)